MSREDISACKRLYEDIKRLDKFIQEINLSGITNQVLKGIILDRLNLMTSTRKELLEYECVQIKNKHFKNDLDVSVATVSKIVLCYHFRENENYSDINLTKVVEESIEKYRMYYIS